MKIFLSWSGDASKSAAMALYDWLPDIFHDVDLFLSSQDIAAGQRWLFEVSTALEESTVGIICCTSSNLDSKWVLFEAGALAKSVDAGLLIPLGIALEPEDIPPPLSQFQAKSASSRDHMYDIVQSINSANDGIQLTETRLKKAFERWYDQLESSLSKAIQAAEAEADPNKPTVTQDEMLTEILSTLRAAGSKAPTASPRNDSVFLMDSSTRALARLRSEIAELMQTVDPSAKVTISQTHSLIQVRTTGSVPVKLKHLVREIGENRGLKTEFLLRKPSISEEESTA